MRSEVIPKKMVYFGQRYFSLSAVHKINTVGFYLLTTASLCSIHVSRRSATATIYLQRILVQGLDKGHYSVNYFTLDRF